MTVEQRSLSKDHLEKSQSLSLLFKVISWELRRLAAGIWNWVGAGASFLFFLVMVWLKHFWSVPGPGKNLGVVVGTSNFGLLFEYINVLLLVYALFIPFVVTDGVARDYKQRMHEVLMATPVPTRVYVWGRFLATLCVSVSLALLMLIADAGMGYMLGLSFPNNIPLPDFRNMVIVWAVIILPATIFLTGLGFSLGTIWPRRSTSLMLATLIAWVILFVLGNLFYKYFNQSFVYLDPTSAGILFTVYPPFIQTIQQALVNVPVEQQTPIMLQIQTILPDLTRWVLPHYGVALLGVALVGAAAASFKRFRDVLN